MARRLLSVFITAGLLALSYPLNAAQDLPQATLESLVEALSHDPVVEETLPVLLARTQRHLDSLGEKGVSVFLLQRPNDAKVEVLVVKAVHAVANRGSVYVELSADNPGLALLVEDALLAHGLPAAAPKFTASRIYGSIPGESVIFGGDFAPRLVGLAALATEEISAEVRRAYDHAANFTRLQFAFRHSSGKYLLSIPGYENNYYWGDPHTLYQLKTKWGFGGTSGHGASFLDYRAEAEPGTFDAENYVRFTANNGILKIQYQGREEVFVECSEEEKRRLVREFGRNHTPVVLTPDERVLWNLFFIPSTREFLVVDRSKTESNNSTRVFRGLPGNMRFVPCSPFNPPERLHFQLFPQDSLSYMIRFADGTTLLVPNPDVGNRRPSLVSLEEITPLENLSSLENRIFSPVFQSPQIAAGRPVGAALEIKDIAGFGIAGLGTPPIRSSTPLDLFLGETASATCEKRLANEGVSSLE